MPPPAPPDLSPFVCGCRDRLRDQEKEVDRAVATARDRARAIRADEADDSEEEPELWRRVPICVG